MERLQAGHDAALNDLMERHATPVFHFLCRMTGNEDDANDLAQETFVRVFKSARQFPRGTKIFHLAVTPSPRTWRAIISAGVRGIRTFRSKRKMRKPEQTLGSTLPANSPAPNEEALAGERAAAVRARRRKICRKICAKRLCFVNGRNTASPKPRQFWKRRLKAWNLGFIAPGIFCASD